MEARMIAAGASGRRGEAVRVRGTRIRARSLSQEQLEAVPGEDDVGGHPVPEQRHPDASIPQQFQVPVPAMDEALDAALPGRRHTESSSRRR
jgi:hypothetical protein